MYLDFFLNFGKNTIPPSKEIIDLLITIGFEL
jgi:hypothetical protein